LLIKRNAECEQVAWNNVRAAENVANEMLAITWRENEM
jgi:hypothetical protein